MSTMMEARVTKLEGRMGKDDLDRWVRCLSDEELEGRLVEYNKRIRGCLTTAGVACQGLDTKALLALLEKTEGPAQ